MGRTPGAEGGEAGSKGDEEEGGKVKLKYAKYPMPKTAKEALLQLPDARRLLDAMSPAARAVALKGIQMKLDKVHNAPDLK